MFTIEHIIQVDIDWDRAGVYVRVFKIVHVFSKL